MHIFTSLRYSRTRVACYLDIFARTHSFYLWLQLNTSMQEATVFPQTCAKAKHCFTCKNRLRFVELGRLPVVASLHCASTALDPLAATRHRLGPMQPPHTSSATSQSFSARSRIGHAYLVCVGEGHGAMNLLKRLNPAISQYRDRRFHGTQEEFERCLAASTTIYVGNLSFYTTEHQIYEVGKEVQRERRGLGTLAACLLGKDQLLR